MIILVSVLLTMAATSKPEEGNILLKRDVTCICVCVYVCVCVCVYVCRM